MLMLVFTILHCEVLTTLRMFPNKLAIKHYGSNLDSLATVVLVTRHNSQCMNKMVSGIEIDRTRVAQAIHI